MSEEHSKFDIWWTSPQVKRVVGASFSVGATIVIIGAMFKILHLPGAAVMLGIGMTVEAVLFMLGVLDKPHKEYEWHKVFDFESGEPLSIPAAPGADQTVGVSQKSHPETIGEELKHLSDGIVKFTHTLNDLEGLSVIVESSKTLAKNLDQASDVTGQYVSSQEALNSVTAKLNTAYHSINEGMETVESNTKLYSNNIDDVNKNLSSLNSIYELHLKSIQSQTDSFVLQSQLVEISTSELKAVNQEIEKMKEASVSGATNTLNFQVASEKLVSQVQDLNKVYGNMLNAIN